MSWKYAAALLMLIACGRGDQPSSRLPKISTKAVPVASPLRSIPLVFQEGWVSGAISYEPAQARAMDQPLRLTTSLKLTGADEALKHLQHPLFQEPCFRVQILYRQNAKAPAIQLRRAYFHEPVVWFPTPLVCLYAGVEWSRQVILHPGTEDSDPRGERLLVLTSGMPRSAAEELSVVLFRQPDTDEERADFPKNFDSFVVARSEWVSLTRIARIRCSSPI